MALGATKTTADDDTVGAVAFRAVLGNEVVGRNQVGILEAVLCAEDLDSVDFNLLGYTVALRSNSTRAVRSMAEVIDVGALDKALDLVGATFKLLLLSLVGI